MGFFDKVDSVKQKFEQQNAALKEKLEQQESVTALKEKFEQKNAQLKGKIEETKAATYEKLNYTPPTEEEKEQKRLEEERKEQEREKEIADKKEAINKTALRQAFGEPVFFIDGRSSNMWVYPDKVIMDRSKGGLLNLFNRNVKVIPMKNILTVQFKNAGAFVGSIEIGVAGSDANEKGIVDTENENLFMFGSTESGRIAFDAFFYIVDKITKNTEK